MNETRLVLFYLFVSLNVFLLGISFFVQWKLFKQRKSDLLLSGILGLSAISYFLYSIEATNPAITYVGYAIDFILAMACMHTFGTTVVNLKKKLGIPTKEIKKKFSAKVPYAMQENIPVSEAKEAAEAFLSAQPIQPITRKPDKYKIVIDKNHSA